MEDIYPHELTAPLPMLKDFTGAGSLGRQKRRNGDSGEAAVGVIMVNTGLQLNNKPVAQRDCFVCGKKSHVIGDCSVVSDTVKKELINLRTKVLH